MIISHIQIISQEYMSRLEFPCTFGIQPRYDLYVPKVAIKTYIKSNSERQKVFWNIATGKIMVCIYDNKSYIYIYIRQVQVTPSVTLKSYTFSKPLDLSRSNIKKNALINADILIRISFIILIYNISYLSLIPTIGIFFSQLSLSHPRKIIRYSQSTINAYSLLSHEWWVPP